MLLRSSSTPILGSLLASISESPNNSPYVDTNTITRHVPPLPSTTFHHSHKKLSFNQSASVNSSPMSESSFNLNGQSNKGLRRAQSEGNLQTLAYGSSSCNDRDEYYTSKPPLHKHSMLETIPSFSYCNSRGVYEDEEDEQSDEEKEQVFMITGSGSNKNAGFVSDKCNVSYGVTREMVSTEMYLARGLGVNVDPFGGFGSSDICNGGVGGWGGNFNLGNPGNGDGDGDGDNLGVEERYKRMVEANPCNPLLLRNYAQFLYQSKKDLHGAEEYYSRAILVDPNDGDILCQYAKLIWELHRDEDRALSYFERAVQASPEDSHVHAAYASFVWEIEDDGDGEDDEVHVGISQRPFHETMASVIAS